MHASDADLDSDMQIFTWKMKHLDSDFEKGPAIFKEQITTEDVPLAYPREAEKPDEEEYVPEISGVEYDQFLVPREQSPEALQLTSQINVDAQEIREAPSGRDLAPIYEVEVHEEQSQEPLDLRLDLSAFKSSEESDEKEPERIDITGEIEAPGKPEPDFNEQYEFKIPKEGYPYVADKQYAVDMSVRTEDEVSELPESEIASMISDRKEIDRRDSDVSLSDTEYPEKMDDVSISDSSEEAPYISKKPLPAKGTEKSEEPKGIIGESDFDISLGTPSEISTDVTLGIELGATPKTEKETKLEKEEVEFISDAMKDAIDAESPDEYDESIGAIPAKVFGDVYMEEIAKLTGKPIAADVVFQAAPSAETSEKEKVKELQPEKDELASVDVEEKEYESGEEETDRGLGKPKRRFLLHEKKDRDKYKDYPESFYADEEDALRDGTYIYGDGVPRPKLKLFQRLDESETSESEATTSPSEGSFLVPSSESQRQSEESIGTPIKSEEETTESESTIKEEFITKVESLDEKPQQLISVREYLSSEEDEQKDFVSTGDSFEFDVRTESPVIETGFTTELMSDLSRITEDEEPEGTESESSEISQDSVQEVPGFTQREEPLHQIPEEGETVDITLGADKERGRIPKEGKIIEEAFTIEETQQTNAQAPVEGLHIEHEVIVKFRALLG